MLSLEPEKELLRPEPVRPNAGRLGAGTVLLACLCAGGLGFAAAPYLISGAGQKSDSATALRDDTSNRASGVPVLLAQSIDGAFEQIDTDVVLRFPLFLAKLQMPERERQRVRDELRQGRLRLAAIKLRDTFDQDGDTVSVSAAGFTQHLTILHAEQTFMVPVLPGSTVRITAARDGGGGDVTLGVSTIFGPVPLLPLAPGQSIEIPVL